MPRATTVVIPVARSCAYRRRALLPTPGSPRISSALLLPSRAALSRPSSRKHSASRPHSTSESYSVSLNHAKRGFSRMRWGLGRRTVVRRFRPERESQCATCGRASISQGLGGGESLMHRRVLALLVPLALIVSLVSVAPAVAAPPPVSLVGESLNASSTGTGSSTCTRV